MQVSQREAAYQAMLAQNLVVQLPHRELPAGIFWERTGGKTHRLTIRRRPEVVFGLSGLANVGAT